MPKKGAIKVAKTLGILRPKVKKSPDDAGYRKNQQLPNEFEATREVEIAATSACSNIRKFRKFKV